MNPQHHGACLRLPARYSRALGAACLLQFALLCFTKIHQNALCEVMWLSHVSLLIAGVALLLRRPGLLAIALINILGVHTVWLLDAAGLALTGRAPLGITAWLADADLLSWASTTHHLFLAPMLIVLVYRTRPWHWSLPLGSVGVFAILTVASRSFLPVANNINWAFGLLKALDHPAILTVNSLPGPLFLPALNIFTLVTMFLPAALLVRVWGHPMYSQPVQLPTPHRELVVCADRAAA